MYDLTPNNACATVDADADRRKAAVSEARGVRVFTFASAVPGVGNLDQLPQAPFQAQIGTHPRWGENLRALAIPAPRIYYFARRIHLLGERPLAELFIELAAGGDLHVELERYARLTPAADLIRAFGGGRLAGPH